MKKNNFNDIGVGNLMAIVTFVKVEQIHRSKQGLMVIDVDNGTRFEVLGKELIEQLYSADQSQQGEEVTKTQLAEKLVSSFNLPLTVVFEKSDGTERTLRGRLISAEPLLGRSMVEDLDLESKDRLRLVDHRTLKSLTVNNVTYTLKK